MSTETDPNPERTKSVQELLEGARVDRNLAKDNLATWMQRWEHYYNHTFLTRVEDCITAQTRIEHLENLSMGWVFGARQIYRMMRGGTSVNSETFRRGAVEIEVSASSRLWDFVVKNSTPAELAEIMKVRS